MESPCKNCKSLHWDKSKCSETCKSLSEFQAQFQTDQQHKSLGIWRRANGHKKSPSWKQVPPAEE